MSAATTKIGVIISHEYLTRVRSKWFILSTLLGPLAMSLLVLIPALAMMLAGDGANGKVAVVDRTGRLGASIVASDTALFTAGGQRSEQDLTEAVRNEELQAYVIIPADILDKGRVTMYSRGGSGISFEQNVSEAIEPFVVDARLERAGADTSVIRLVQQGVEISALKITDKGVEEDASTVSAAVGYAAGFVIYILIFLYGTMVMRGVVDEKANRIVEVLASSARPYHIMMGKVVGIGLVGLTQLVMWIVLGSGALMIIGALIGSSGATVDPQAMAAMSGGAGADKAAMFSKITSIPALSLPSLILFVFYFLCGYFIYATLFAAVGSAVDQEADANQLTFPVTFPVILTMLFIGNVIASPNGTFAVVLSLIPLFSPILMTVRVAATDVPLWQILASVVLMIGTFFGAVWLASRIYRIGILSYGKKPTFRDIGRWIKMNV